MKILCVGMNYVEHNKELNNTLYNSEPVLFSKPESALIREGKPFFIPDFAERFDYETEIVVRINRLGKDIAERFAYRYYNEVTVGIDFTARDLQDTLRSKGLPWDICKGFDGAAALGHFVDKSELFAMSDIISINCALTDETKNLINQETVSQMKDGVILVNTARGSRFVLRFRNVERAVLNLNVLFRNSDLLLI